MIRASTEDVVANLKRRIGELSYENAVLEAALEAKERDEQSRQNVATELPKD